MKKVFVIHAGEGVTFGEEALEEITLDYLQEKVGGWVQAVPLDGVLSGLTLWMNEEGKFSDLPLNEIATGLWEVSYGATDFIAGNAILTAGVDYEGDTLGLTSEELDTIMEAIQKVMAYN
jgi:hypothetical protein